MSLIIVYIRSESDAATAAPPPPSLNQRQQTGCHAHCAAIRAHLHKTFQFNFRAIFDYAVEMEKRKTEKTKANSEGKLYFVAAFVFEKLAKQ